MVSSLAVFLWYIYALHGVRSWIEPTVTSTIILETHPVSGTNVYNVHLMHWKPQPPPPSWFLRSKTNMPKHEKPILDVQAVRANRDHFRHWETRFHDYCLLEGYRDPSKDRQTATAEHYIAAKRPYEIAVLRTAIPATEWNTLDDVIASKIPAADQGKPWIWLERLKQHYVGASTLMQDRYYFWAKMSQPDQTSITAWETTVRTAAGRCSFGQNADEFMRDKFLFGLNDSCNRFGTGCPSSGRLRLRLRSSTSTKPPNRTAMALSTMYIYNQWPTAPKV